jgi:hypothetical protein
LGGQGRAGCRARQAAIQELRPQLDLREELALVGEDLRPGIARKSNALGLMRSVGLEV